MTRDEAFQMMCEGHKVTHYNFTSSEYLYMIDNQVHTEDGCYFEDRFYQEDFFKDGWSIYKEEKKIVLTNPYNLKYYETPAITVEKEPKPWYHQFGNKRSIY